VQRRLFVFLYNAAGFARSSSPGAGSNCLHLQLGNGAVEFPRNSDRTYANSVRCVKEFIAVFL
jgi:hypothetical protein